MDNDTDLRGRWMTQAIVGNGRPESGDGAPAPHRLASSTLGGHIPFLLAQARASITANANAALAELGLKVRTFSVLWLAGEGLDPTQRELSEFLSLDPSQVVPLVDELERRGAVNRQADPRDRRSRIIAITPAGRRLLRRALILTESADDQSLSALTTEERASLRALLGKVVGR